MFCQIFTRKMGMVILLFLVVLAVTAIAYAQGQGDNFPIIAYGSLHADYFPQMMDCNFNAVFRYDFDENDFIVADAESLYLVTGTFREACQAQWSRYESDEHADPPVMEHFSHSNVIGREEYDEMFDLYTWRAQVSVDTAGWMQRELMGPYNNEQQIPTYRIPSTDYLTYYAHFRMRLASDAVAPDPPAPIAKIDAIRIFERDTITVDTTIVVEDSLWYSDFDTAGALGQYADFAISFQRTKADSGVMDYRIYWYDNTDLWVDRVVLEDERYRTLIAGGYDDAIRSKVNQYNGYSSLFRWYLEDEPDEDQFAANGYVRAFLDDSVNTVPGMQALYGYPVEHPEFFHHYVEVVNPDELAYFRYPINFWADSTTTSNTNTSLQVFWDRFVPYYKGLKEIANLYGKPFWFCQQAFEWRRPSGEDWVYYKYRYPTSNELKCNVWLGLCCGAQGLLYYTYASRGGPDGKDDPSDTLSCSYLEGEIISPPTDWIRGLVEWDEGANTWVKVVIYPSDTLWNAVRDMNAVVDSLGDLLLRLTWVDEGRWDEVNNLSGSYINSITSEQYPDTSVYVEVGFFEDLDLCKYFMLVNRRCLSSETQTVTVEISKSGLWAIRDVYSGEETLRWDEDGVLTFTTTLGPGEGKLLRLKQDSALRGFKASSEGMGLNNGRRFISDSGGDFHFCFTGEGDSIYYHPMGYLHSPWLVGKGRYPALARTTDDSLVFVWSSGDTLFYGDQGIFEEGGNKYLGKRFLAATSPPLTGVSSPSFVIDQETNTGFVSWQSTGYDGSSSGGGGEPIIPDGNCASWSIWDIDFNANFQLTRRYYLGWYWRAFPGPFFHYQAFDSSYNGLCWVGAADYEDLSGPSIDLDTNEVVHIVWDKLGEIYYYQWNGEAFTNYLNISQSLMEPSQNPCLSCDGQAVRIVWEEEGDILSRTVVAGVLADTVQNISQSPDDLSTSPFIIGRYVCWRQGDEMNLISHDQWTPVDAILFSRRCGGGWTTPQNVSNSTLAPSQEPQMVYHPPANPLVSGGSLYFMWAEGDPPYFRFAKVGLNPCEEEEITCFNLGQPDPSPVTLERAGWLSLGPEQYKSVDYDSSALVYLIPDLDPGKNYRLQAGFYQEFGEEIGQRFQLDGAIDYEVQVPSAKAVTTSKLLPDSILQDGEVQLTIKGLNGAQAVCPLLILYEYSGTGPGQPKRVVSSSDQLPDHFSLSQNYPNPFNSVTEIKYNLPEDCWVRLEVFNILGRRVATLVDGFEKAGFKASRLDAGQMASGIYFYRLKAGGYTKVRKMVLIR